MTATADKYRPRFYSEVVKEAIGSYDDCAICSGLVLLDCATLGEAVTRDDGSLMNTIQLRELRDEAGLRPNGPLRLNDIAQYLAFISQRASFLPPFALDYYPGHGGTLRLTWDGFRKIITELGVGILLGNPVGVKDPQSPLRTVQNNDDYGHAIAVMDGNATSARVYDPLNRNGPNFPGVRVSWDDLRQYTEARKNGERLYGSADAIACAVATIGSDTQAARASKKALATAARLNQKVSDAKAQVTLHADERDQARRDLAAATARIAELEANPPDCGPETDRAVRAEDIIAKVKALVSL